MGVRSPTCHRIPGERSTPLCAWSMRLPTWCEYPTQADPRSVRPRWRCWSVSACLRRTNSGGGTRTSSPAGNSSASASLQRWPPTPKSLCSTNRPPASTSSPRTEFSTELLRLRDEQQVSMLYVTHDLAVAAQIADRIVVVYGGYIVEEGPAEQVLRRPAHPYTRGLLRATPDHAVMRALTVMQGVPVDVGDRPPGCPFSPRCDQKIELWSPSFRRSSRQASTIVSAARNGAAHRQSTGPQRDRRRSTQSAKNPSPSSKSGSACRTQLGAIASPPPRASPLTLHRGECVALVGESGSGKTTIARVIAGLAPDLEWVGPSWRRPR